MMILDKQEFKAEVFHVAWGPGLKETRKNKNRRGSSLAKATLKPGQDDIKDYE